MTVPDPGETRQSMADAVARGWHVFPTRGKQPRPGFRWGQFAACAEVKLLAGEGYAIACRPSGLVVVDLDTHGELPPEWRGEPGISSGWDVLAALAERAGVREWLLTYTVITPSGGGHLYFAAPDGIAVPNRSPGPMIDVRASGGQDGGYVIGAGSGAYRLIDGQDPAPLPPWLAALILPAETVPREPPPFRGQIARGMISPRYAEVAVEGEIGRVLSSANGRRNHALNTAAFSLGRLIVQGLVNEDAVCAMLADAGAAAGLEAREISGTIASGFRAAARQS